MQAALAFCGCLRLELMVDCEKCPYIKMTNRIKKIVEWVRNHAAVTVFVAALLFAIIGVPYILLMLEFDWLDSGDC